MNNTVPFLTSSEEEILKKEGYTLISKLGGGSYAKVFLGQLSKGQKKTKLACKVIDTNTVKSNYSKKFLPRELEILSKINHPHIIHVHSIFQKGSKYFIFMRYAEMGDLLKYLLGNGPAKQDQARGWIRQLALAIQYLHTLEIVHRDLKCENVLITINSNIKLADFGFSKSLVSKTQTIEPSETFCGSLAYVAPEILRGITYQPKPTDLWSLGVVIYTMLNKAHPFSCKQAQILYKSQMKRRWKFRSKYENSICEKAKDLIRNLIEPDVNKRYTIEQVLNSDFISMDSSMKTLTPEELQALTNAMDASKYLRRFSNTSEITRRSSVFGQQKERSDIQESDQFVTKYINGFDLELIRSDFLEKPEIVALS